QHRPGRESHTNPTCHHRGARPRRTTLTQPERYRDPAAASMRGASERGRRTPGAPPPFARRTRKSRSAGGKAADVALVAALFVDQRDLPAARAEIAGHATGEMAVPVAVAIA